MSQIPIKTCNKKENWNSSLLQSLTYRAHPHFLKSNSLKGAVVVVSIQTAL